MDVSVLFPVHCVVFLALSILSCSFSLGNRGTALSCPLRFYSFREDLLGFLRITSSHHHGVGIQTTNPFRGWRGGDTLPGRFARYPDQAQNAPVSPSSSRGGGPTSGRGAWPSGGRRVLLESPGGPSAFGGLRLSLRSPSLRSC